MKKINLFAMSLLATAAFTFYSCSNDDTMPSTTTSQQETTQDFMMKMTITTPTTSGTRTEQNNNYNAITGEHEVNSGTIYITNASKGVVYQKTISTSDWENMKIPSESNTGSTTLEIPIKNVEQGPTYYVYFLANTTDATPWTSTYTANSKFSGTYGVANQFAMFNQNDATVSADEYTVKFEEKNKSRETPATITGNKVIKIERIAARIDQPTSTATTIEDYKTIMTAEELDELNDKQKAAMDEAVKKVESITLTRYAVANLAKSTYIMQHWDNSYATLVAHATAWWQPYSEFGTTTQKDNDGYFKAIGTTDAAKKANFDYVFENNVADANDATSMYVEYTITLKDDESATKDFTDGTFYRFDNKIYTSIKDIMKAYENQSNPFGTFTEAQLLDELKIVDGKTTLSEEKLSKFRTDHLIEIFVGGKAYYKTTIEDQYHKETGRYLIQRNSVYQLNVKNVLSIGADVPNGNPDDVNPMYYLNVQVTVNPWVLNTYETTLK